MPNDNYESDRLQCTAKQKDGTRCKRIGTHSNGSGVLCGEHQLQHMKEPMQTAGVVIEPWKLPIFKKHLHAAGLTFTQEAGPVKNTLLLKIRCKSAIGIKPIIAAAHEETQRK